MNRLNINGKNIYTFSNHAHALLAWYDVWVSNENKPLNLITFDNHTDTYMPILRHVTPAVPGALYGASKAREILNPIKSKPSREAIAALCVNNDEHITTALYLNLIKEAFICCASSGTNGEGQEKDIKAIYNHIHYMDEVYNPNNNLKTLPVKANINYLTSSQRQNISDDTINLLISQGVDTKDDYILDIDLDYFTNIRVLKERNDFSEFKKLVKKSRAITIATEEVYVGKNVELMQMEAGEEHAISWNAEDCLQLIMEIIKEALSE